jgi:hypothetical protein
LDLSRYLEGRLEASGVSLEELRELLVRLLNYGVLARGESQVERELYDRFVRIEELVGETLILYGIEHHHDRRFEYVRLYPPGSSTPGMDQASERAFGGSLRARLSQHEVALILVLRAQYDKALREGKVDGQGYATEPLEAVSLALRNWLSRTLPERATERRRVFQRLRQLRLIEYGSEDDLEQSEAWLRIHPMIVDFVSAEAIEVARGAADPTGRPHASTGGNGHAATGVEGDADVP